jgi:hypothetical protein
MSAKNRTDLKAEIAAWPESNFDIVVNHKPSEQNILDSVVLNRDVLDSIAVTTGATNVNFTDKDTITVNTAMDTVLTIQNLVDGESKTLIIVKTGIVNQVTFANATEMGYDQNYLNQRTTLRYKLISKGALGIIAFPLNPSFDFSAIPAPETAGSWNEASLSSPWTSYPSGARGGVWYRLNRGYIDISCSITRTLAFNNPICTLPAGYRPSYEFIISAMFNAAITGFHVRIDTTGAIVIVGGGTSPINVQFTVSIPLT